MGRDRALRLALLALVVAAGLALRCADLAAFGMSPDDGNYLHSAAVQRMDPERGWIEQDLEWAGERKAYPHSYLHQLVIRWLERSGADHVHALRLGSAVLGGLTSLLVYLLMSRGGGRSRRVGLLAAALLAGYLMHAWYSRTGWGQIGCTFFFVAYLACAERLFLRPGPRTARDVWPPALGMAVAALGAYGYHEMIVVHVAGMGVWSLLYLAWNRGAPDAAGRKLAWIAFLVSCLPVAAWATTLLTDEFAQANWTGLVQEKYSRGYFEYRWWILRKLLRYYRLHEQIGWVVMALAAAGMVVTWRRDRERFRFLFTAFTVSWAAFFFAFRDPYLIRVYLPTFVLLIVFAAEALVALAEAAAPRVRVAGRVATALVLALLWGQSVTTLFLEEETPLTVNAFYVPWKTAQRDPLGPISDHLLEHRRPGEILGVSGDRSPHFRLQDRGISSRPYNGAAWTRPLAEQAEWVVAVRAQMETARRTTDLGGPWELVVTDTTGRLGLYRIRRP